MWRRDVNRGVVEPAPRISGKTGGGRTQDQLPDRAPVGPFERGRISRGKGLVDVGNQAFRRGVRQAEAQRNVIDIARPRQDGPVDERNTVGEHRILRSFYPHRKNGVGRTIERPGEAHQQRQSNVIVGQNQRVRSGRQAQCRRVAQVFSQDRRDPVEFLRRGWKPQIQGFVKHALNGKRALIRCRDSETQLISRGGVAYHHASPGVGVCGLRVRGVVSGGSGYACGGNLAACAHQINGIYAELPLRKIRIPVVGKGPSARRIRKTRKRYRSERHPRAQSGAEAERGFSSVWQRMDEYSSFLGGFDLMENLDLSTFHNEWYRPGRSRTVQALWFFLGAPIVRCSLNPSSGLRASILRLFGARIGAGAVLKPGLRIKYPWRLSVGDHTWLGEDCWIDNLADVAIGSHVCISQGAFLCTGNHDWSDPSFALKLGPITIRDGAWVGARALVCPGVKVGKLAILVAGSVARKNLPRWRDPRRQSRRFPEVPLPAGGGCRTRQFVAGNGKSVLRQPVPAKRDAVRLGFLLAIH